MAIGIAEYSPDNFNRLRDFRDALSGFDKLKGEVLASTTMKDLFRHHGVEGILGLQLLHKHDKLNDGERLTDVRGTSNPLTFDIGAIPSIWGFDSGIQQLVPLEYSLGAENIEWDAPNMQEFLVAFRETIMEKGVADIFGLSLYPGDGYPGRVEFSVGRGNVNLTPEEAGYLPSSSTREAAWFYTEDFMKRGCRCNCFNTSGHNHSHGITRST